MQIALPKFAIPEGIRIGFGDHFIAYIQAQTSGWFKRLEKLARTATPFQNGSAFHNMVAVQVRKLTMKTALPPAGTKVIFRHPVKKFAIIKHLSVVRGGVDGVSCPGSLFAAR